MKKLYTILLAIPLFAIAQNPNYVKTTEYKVPTLNGLTSTDGSGAVTFEKKVVNVVYFDGLGRPIQKVAHLQSGTGKNIVLPIVYDASGTVVKNYLPYPSESTSPNYVDNTSVISSLQSYYSTEFVDGVNPYSEVLLEASPFRRVQKKSAPGADWMMPVQTGDPDHTIRFDYLTNTANEVRKYYAVADASVNPPTLNYSTSYSAGELTKTVLKNENWVSNSNPSLAKNNTVEEFNDKEGKLILKRTYESGQKHDTYYVYDQYGNLTFVIPPIVNTDGAVSENDLAGYCYQYKYDERNRLIEKQLPGKKREFIVYDKLNRIVATGPAFSPFTDDVAPNNLGWMIVKYDVFNRPIVTGWMLAPTFTSVTRNNLQIENDNHAPMYTSDTKIQNTVTVNGIGMRYDNYSWPNSTSRYHILTVNYYDDYNFPNAPTAFNAPNIYFNTTDKKPRGLPTGSLVRILTTKSNFDADKTYILYDKKGRGIIVKTTNTQGGYLQQESQLDFIGKPLSVITKHKKDTNASEISVKDSFTYTSEDRLKSQTHQIGNGVVQLLRMNEYNKLGQLIRKAVGNTSLTGTAAFQKVDYRYNIRGWLTDINDANQLLKSGDPKDLFGFKINYNTVENELGYTGAVQYNGNISETYWSSAADNGVRRKYGYFYDDLNRLNEAVYMKPDNMFPVTQSFNESMDYDKNGNIMHLKRNGNSDYDDPSSNATPIDDLVYGYKTYTNQLIKVTDEGHPVVGFKDGVDEETEYDYDDAGNMKRDANKGIQAIIYNHLNLPTSITFTTGDKIEYIYNGLGAKISKKVTKSNVVQQTDYQGGFQFIGGKLAFFPTSEGYVDATGGSYKYVFQYKDHLGNIRVSYTQEAGQLKILEENNYYPFGMKHANYNSAVYDYLEVGGTTVLGNVSRSKNQFKYNGQEYQDELDLNITAMDFRQYDNALGRFHCIDPVDHYSQSPYSGLDNNPVFWADPSGADVINSALGVTFTGADAGKFYSAFVNALETGTGVFNYNEGDVVNLFASENHGGGEYSPSAVEAVIRAFNGITGIIGQSINSFNDLIAILTGQKRHMYGPDAIIYSKGVDGGYYGTFTSSAGFILITRGKYAGEFYALGDYGAGIGAIGITTGLTAEGVYYSGDIGDIQPQTFAGMRFSGTIGISNGFSVSLILGYAQTTGGVTYTFGYSGGIGTPGVGGDINFGETVIKVP